MKPEKPLRETLSLLIGLVIVGLATTAIIATFRPKSPGIVPITMTSFIATSTDEPTMIVPSPYPGPMDYLTPTEAARQTAQAPLDTQYAIMMATKLAITPSQTEPATLFPTGTVEDDVYLSSSGMGLGVDTQNAWVGFIDGMRADIYAGARLEDTEQGAIFLFVDIPRGGIAELILTPTKHGGVRVVSEQNNRLTLVSTDGTTYYFDLPARRFVDSLTEVVPTATPPATETPLPPPPTLSFSSPTPTPNPYPAPTKQSTAAP